MPPWRRAECRGCCSWARRICNRPAADPGERCSPVRWSRPRGIAITPNHRASLAHGQALRQHGLPDLGAMPTSLYGPGDNFLANPAHLLPALIHHYDGPSQWRAQRVNCPDGSCCVDDLAAALPSAGTFRRADRRQRTGIDHHRPGNRRDGASAVGYSGETRTRIKANRTGTPRKLLRCFGATGRQGWRPSIALCATASRATVAYWHRETRERFGNEAGPSRSGIFYVATASSVALLCRTGLGTQFLAPTAIASGQCRARCQGQIRGSTPGVCAARASRACIVSFEPLPGPCRLLQRSLHGPVVKCRLCAGRCRWNHLDQRRRQRGAPAGSVLPMLVTSERLSTSQLRGRNEVPIHPRLDSVAAGVLRPNDVRS